MDPLLSICIPSYNRCRLLKRLTEQLLTLKSDKIEFVFLDDCSTEEEVIEYLQEAEQRDNRVVLYQNEQNLGITKNYYSCLHHASGKYLMLLSNEDQIPSDFEKVVFSLLENGNYNAIYGSLKRPFLKDNLYKNEHPKKDTNDFDLIKSEYAQIVFRGHISGFICKKKSIDFNLLKELSTLKDSYWPITPITLMMMRTKNVLFTTKSFVIIGADCTPETENGLKQSNKNKKEIRYLFSLEKRANLYNYFIKKIIEEKDIVDYQKILARYFIFFGFHKKRIGITQLRDINAIKKHPEIGKYFKTELRNNYLKYHLDFFKACINKYLDVFWNLLSLGRVINLFSPYQKHIKPN